ARAHLAVELVVEHGVDVDRLVGRAVERAHRARRRAAVGVDAAAGDEVKRRLTDADPGLAERRLPGLVETAQRVARFGGVLVLGAQRLLVLRRVDLRRRALLGAIERAEHLRRVDP